MAQKDHTASQLSEYAREKGRSDLLTTSAGNPVGQKMAVMTVGERGPVLIKDHVFQDEMSHFTRERIPERVVHAKGGGAFGEFEVINDITRYCKADIFSHVGKKTPMGARFSTVAGEAGSADTVRDPRGFALKFYTDEGNWDLVGNNTPIFFIRDPMLFTSFVHSQKRNPETHTRDIDAFWDFITLRPECMHQTAIQFSDRGTPDGFRHMNGYSSHAYKMINAKGEHFWVKFHHKTDQGIKNMPVEKCLEIAPKDPDYAIRDLYNAIANKNYPSWTMKIQVMTPAEAEREKFNPFDMTKIWPQGRYPLIPVGRFTLNRNPKNYFTEIEQIAFSPTHMPPGIEASPDKMLQARLFAYDDTHRHRLGANYIQLPVNRPLKETAHYMRDGPMCHGSNGGGAPNYHPNSFSGPEQEPRYLEHAETYSGAAKRFDSSGEDDYSQATDFWNKVLCQDGKRRLCDNIASHLTNAQPFIQKRAVHHFKLIHSDFGRRVEELLDKYNSAKANM